MKTYTCNICHRILDGEKPIRLVEQLYGVGRYNQYKSVCHYDFCEVCYLKFAKWIRKHNREKNYGEENTQ